MSDETDTTNMSGAVVHIGGRPPGAFACEQCRAGKRKCDGTKPQCSLCQRLSKSCTYGPEPGTRKRKYWDEDYVHSLEKQVQSLLDVVERLQKHQDAIPPVSEPPQGSGIARLNTVTPTIEGRDTTDQDRSLAAMEQLSVMMWRTNLGDGAVIMQDDQHTAPFRITRDRSLGLDMDMQILAPPPPTILNHCQNRALLVRLAVAFLDNINREHQFTEYRSADFLEGYPHQPADLALMHTAILAVGAAFLSARDPLMGQVSEDFARYAERFLFDSFRYKPSLAVLQSLCMLSFRSLSLGMDHVGWMFLSMAGGLCVHLRLHVLAVDECTTRSRTSNAAEIRRFWMYYFVDKSAITIVGRNCALPWRRVNVPDLQSIIPSPSPDIADLSFAWQCRLWYTHDAAMDQICARSFESLPATEQVRLLVSTIDQLRVFLRSRPSQLDLSPDATKPVILFHLQYHMAVMIITSPFLRIFTHTSLSCAGDENSEVRNSILLVLQSITSSASDSMRLCRTYRDKFSFDAAHPVLAHHLLSAAMVHLMNATSKSPSLRRKSAHWLRIGMDLLDQLKVVWPARASKSITVIRVLAQKWGTTGALPLRFSGPIEPSEPVETGEGGQLPTSISVRQEQQHQHGSMTELQETAIVEDEESQLPELPFAYHDQTLGMDMHMTFLDLANLVDLTEEV